MKEAEVIKESAQKLLDLLEMKGKISLKKEEEIFTLSIETEETGLLIGYHGQTLEGFQLILRLLVYHKLGEWQEVVVDVGQYREKRQKYLEELAQKTAEQVAQTKEEIPLPGLSAAERRIVHIALQDNSEVKTESQGEGEERRIIVKSK